MKVRTSFAAIFVQRTGLTAIARLHDLPEETVGDLKLALTEACTNSVRHAYDNGEGAVTRIEP